ncbi:hypothetical protein [Petroclostridium sp. X23]|uniref:hypothetical protein n=1 Tax=Petroclostridium sp. X23 TaxID=3045146 RepID=UPI0024ACFFC2|nr:hypothetical protein [Petroclostridium sp. X23]WHH59654.1 hypothetical protein QKW49_02515 [Petroclostridium sp. X23]
MKFIYFNPETRMGYISDPLTPEEAAVIADGIGYYMAFNIIAMLITAVVILPFIVVAGLDKFLISFISVNRDFIIGTAIVLILIKFLTVRLSSALIVRFLFALMVIIPVLYVLLYKFHMADITVSIGKRFELTEDFLKAATVQSTWIESSLQNISDALSKVFFGLTNAAKSIDYSAFSSSLSTINIASILICIGKTILYWGLLIVYALLIFVFGLIAFVIIIGFPYFIAFGVLVLVNNLIYNIKLNYARYLKF